MKLLWSSRSPFVRKVMVVLHELGLKDRVETQRVLVSADTVTAEVLQFNPLNQIPSLLLDDGAVLFDSPVIVEYLDTTFGRGELVPADPARRWPVLRLQALGDGLLSFNVQRLGERNRGPLASAAHAAAFEAKTRATLDWLEQNASQLQPLSAGSIAVACGLAHLDFRFPDDGWRGERPRLSAFQTAMDARPSFRATVPQDVY